MISVFTLLSLMAAFEHFISVLPHRWKIIKTVSGQFSSDVRLHLSGKRIRFISEGKNNLALTEEPLKIWILHLMFEKEQEAKLQWLLCGRFYAQRALSQVLVKKQGRRSDRQPHGSTLKVANSRESILNDTYGKRRVQFPQMQIGGGLQMKDSKINKVVASMQNSSVSTVQP